MNPIVEFFRAKSFWCKNLHRELDLPESYFTGGSNKFPHYRSQDRFEDLKSPEVSLNPLQIPRHFGPDGSEQILKMIALDVLVKNAFSGDVSFLDLVGKPKDGGSFWDRLIGRGEGDTPIAICEHVTLLNYLALSGGLKDFDSTRRYIDWLSPLVDYVRGYKTAQLNNHLTWKALFLSTSGLCLMQRSLLREAYFLFQTALKKVKDDGSMPLELARDDKAATYTLMNLEALIHLERIFNVKEPKIRAALADFEQCITNHDEWKRRHGLKHQIHPENLHSWGWIFMFEKPLDYTVCQNSYVSHFTGDWK
jgi:hypothetical protein